MAKRKAKEDRPVYVVCKRPSCRQTYPLESFGKITEDTKNINCQKCDGILVDENGLVTLSMNPGVITVRDPESEKRHKIHDAKMKQERNLKNYKTKEGFPMTISSAFKSTVTINGKEKVLVVLNEAAIETKEQSKTVDAIHHIHVIDRSGSMHWTIKGLIENVKETIDAMHDNDYISLLWFSGEGEYGTVIRGARKDESIKKIADTIASTVGMTCFSEVLEKEVKPIINDLKVICPNFAVTFFTDGETVTMHSETEEHNRVMTALNDIKEEIIAFNTIGYGSNYNDRLLKEMSAITPYGVTTHSSQINDYKEIFNHNYKVISELVTQSVAIGTNAEEVLYLTLKTSNLQTAGNMKPDEYKFSHLNKRKNQFVLMFDADSLAKPYIIYNDEKITLSSISKKIPTATLNNILYGLAYEYYYAGRKDESLAVLAQAGDKALIDKQIEAFTYDEMSAYSKILNKAQFNNKSRYLDGRVDSNYLPADDAFCVFDVMNVLASNEVYYVPTKNYNRIGLATEIQNNRFKSSDEEYNGATLINQLTFNKKFLNASIQFSVKGYIDTVDNEVGLGKTIEGKIYRNHSIIKDGTLNMKEIKVLMDTDTLQFINAGFPQIIQATDGTKKFIVDGKFSHHHELTIDLSKFPITNRKYANISADDLLHRTVSGYRMETKVKVLNYLINELKPKVIQDTKETVVYTPEQLEYLKAIGVRSDGSYSPSATKAEKNENDFYEARALELAYKGFSSIPPVEKTLTKYNTGGKLTAPEAALIEAYQDVIVDKESGELISNNLNALELRKTSIQKGLISNRIVINAAKFGLILTGKWFAGLEKDNKDQEFLKLGNDTIIFKRSKEKVYF